MKAAEDKKIYEPEYIDEEALPEAVIWEEIVDKPTTLAELSPADAAHIDSITVDVTDIEATIASLGDLAYENVVNTLQIAAGAVTQAKIAVDAIQGSVIAAGAITATKISNGAVETAKLAAAAVTANEIAANAITASKILAGEVTASKISSINLSVIQAVVGTLSAITANIGTITAGSISGVTITGGTVQTNSSGLRTVLSGANDSIQFMNSSTVYSQIYPYAYPQGNGIKIETGSTKGSGDAWLEVWEGTHAGATLATYLASVEVYDNTVTVDASSMTITAPTTIAGNGNHLTIQDNAFLRLKSMSGATADALSGAQNGCMYYRDDHVIRVRINGAWKSVTVV